jgi:hypothetical protein
MTPSQILTQEAQSQGQDPQRVLKSAVDQVNSGHTVIIQENDSLLFITRLGDGRAMLHLSTIDAPLTLAKSVKGFLHKLKSSELKTVYGDTNNQQILGLMKRVGWHVQKSNLPKFTWMAVVE